MLVQRKKKKSKTELTPFGSGKKTVVMSNISHYAKKYNVKVKKRPLDDFEERLTSAVCEGGNYKDIEIVLNLFDKLKDTLRRQMYDTSWAVLKLKKGRVEVYF